MPIKTWLEGEEFRERVESVFLDNKNPIFSSSYLKHMYKDWKDKGIGYRKVWGIIVFEEWCRLNKIY